MADRSDEGRAGIDRAWYASAALVLLVVAGLVWVLIGGRGGQPSEPASPQPVGASSGRLPTTPLTAAPTSSGWPEVGCNGTSGSSGAPQSVMTDVRWEPFLTVAVPVSPTVGPLRIAGPLRQCFQHSPSGALLASVNIQLASAAGGAQGRQVVQTQYTAGPLREKALRDLARSSGSVANVAAFRLVGCSPTACNVEIVWFGGGLYAVAAVPMTWVGGDWMIDGSKPATEPGVVTGIPPGFTAWSPS